jgi:hypothetical protein
MGTKECGVHIGRFRTGEDTRLHYSAKDDVLTFNLVNLNAIGWVYAH